MPATPRPARLTAFSTAIAEVILTSGILVLAIWSGLTQVSFIQRFSFRYLSTGFSLILLMGAIAILLYLWIGTHYKPWRIPWKRVRVDPANLGILFGLCAIAGLFSLLAITQSGDDVSYVSRVVYFLHHPDQSLDFNLHDNLLLGDRSYFIMLFSTVEFFWGYLTWITGQHFADVYYWLVPSLGGALIPLVWFFVSSKLTRSPPAALLATTAIMLFLGLTAITNKSFGYVAFLRIWQGKAMLMSLLLPLFIAYSLEFFRRPHFWRGIKLFLALVTSLGLSASSLFLMPSLAIALGVAFLAGTFKKRSVLTQLLTLLGYYSIFVPLIAAGAFYIYSTYSVSPWQYLERGGMMAESFNLFFADTFVGQYESVFGAWYSGLSVVAIAILIGCIVLVSPANRRFLLGWIFSALLFLNPWTYPIISQLFTSDNAYWRLFYVLPLPLAVGIVAICGYKNLNPFKLGLTRWSKTSLTYSLCGILLGLALLVNIVPNAYGLAHRIDGFALEHKLDAETQDAIAEILSVSPPGGMLAPFEYSQKVPIYSAEHPQVATHFHMLIGSVRQEEEALLFNQTLRAIAFISHRRSLYIRRYVRPLDNIGDTIETQGLDSLESLLSLSLSPPLTTIVLDAKMNQRRDATQLLRDRHFSRILRNSDYHIYVKEPES